MEFNPAQAKSYFKGLYPRESKNFQEFGKTDKDIKGECKRVVWQATNKRFKKTLGKF